MSRIILTKHDDGEDHIVVGWDRPLQTYYWQEFNQEPAWDMMTDEESEQWEEMAGFAGYSPGELPTAQDLINHAATHSPNVFAAITAELDRGEKLLLELKRHQTLDYPESNVVLDLSTKE